MDKFSLEPDYKEINYIELIRSLAWVLVVWDHYKFLGNYIPTPPLSQHAHFVNDLKNIDRKKNNSLHANATAVVPSHLNQPGHSIADMELTPLVD